MDSGQVSTIRGHPPAVPLWHRMNCLRFHVQTAYNQSTITYMQYVHTLAQAYWCLNKSGVILLYLCILRTAPYCCRPSYSTAHTAWALATLLPSILTTHPILLSVPRQTSPTISSITSSSSSKGGSSATHWAMTSLHSHLMCTQTHLLEQAKLHPCPTRCLLGRALNSTKGPSPCPMPSPNKAYCLPLYPLGHNHQALPKKNQIGENPTSFQCLPG